MKGCWSLRLLTAVGLLLAGDLLSAAVYNPDVILPLSSEVVPRSEVPAAGRVRLTLQRPEQNHRPLTWVAAGQAYRLQVIARKADARLFDAFGRLVWEDFHSVGGILMPHDLVYLQNAGAYRLDVTDRFNNAWGETVWCVLPPVIETTGDGMLGATGGEQCPELLTGAGVSWRRRAGGLGDTRYPYAFKDGKPNVDALRAARDFERRLHLNPLGCLWAPIRPAQLTDAGFSAWKKWWLESYVVPLVRATKDHIHYWEIYDDASRVFGNEPQKYFELLKDTATAIRELDADAQIVGVCGPSELDGDRFYREVLRLGAVEYMDVMSLHMPCTGNRTAANPEKRFDSWFATLRNLLQECDRIDIPIWNTDASFIPAATMYTAAAYPDRIHYHDLPVPSPQEQAAVAARVLTLHNVWNVKVFLPLTPGGVNYGPAPFEFDGTPTAAVAALAAGRQMLENAVYFGNPEIHPRLHLYLFRRSESSVVAVGWLEQLRGGETADLMLVKELRNNRSFDLYGNPGTGNLSMLTFTGVPQYIHFSGQLTDAEWMQSLREGALTIGAERKIEISLLPELQPAAAVDWQHFAPVDLHTVVNFGFSDDGMGDHDGAFQDRGGCDLRMLPPGDLLSDRTPFRILDPAQNNQCGLIVLRDHGQFPAELKDLETGSTDEWKQIHLLLGCAPGTRLPPGTPVLTVNVHYGDGSSESFVLKYQEDLSDLADLRTPKQSPIGVTVPSPCRDRVTLFHKTLTLRRAGVVKTLDLVSAHGATVLVTAITGEKKP